MTRMLKTLGLALAVAFALSALAASAASAASAELFVFDSEVEHTTLVGSQIGTSTMAVDGGSVKCETASFQGTSTTEAVLETTLTPTFGGCIFLALSGTEVDMNSCDLVIGAETKEGSSYEAKAAIDCQEAGDSITITVKLGGVVKCTVHIDEQETLGKVTLEDEGSPTKVRANLKLTGISYDQTAGAGFGKCAQAENTTNGTYEGEAMIEGLNGESHVGLELEPIPQKVKINKNPIKLGGKKNDKAAFEVENVVNEPVTVLYWIHQAYIAPLFKCGKLEKKGDKGDKCQQEIECKDPSGKELELGVITSPVGGDVVKVTGC